VKQVFILILFENSGSYRREKIAKVKHDRSEFCVFRSFFILYQFGLGFEGFIRVKSTEFSNRTSINNVRIFLSNNISLEIISDLSMNLWVWLLKYEWNE